MVDILLVTYNGERYLKEMLDSLLGQTYHEFHIYARDDRSTDGTPAILDGFCRAYPDKITVLRDGRRKGSARDNFFSLLSNARSEYIMFADQDDIWMPDKVESTLSVLREAERKQNGAPLLVHSDLTVVDEEDRILHSSMFALQKLDPERRRLNQLLSQNNITGCTVMINRALADIIRPNEGALMHDWWIGLVAAAFGGILIAPNRIHYRQHQTNEVGAKDVKSVSYVKGKLSDTGQIKKSIQKTYRQAAAFLDAYDDMLNDEQKEMICAFAGLDRYGIWKRMRILSKYKLYKSGLYRKIGQIIYG